MTDTRWLGLSYFGLIQTVRGIGSSTCGIEIESPMVLVARPGPGALENGQRLVY